MTINYHQTDLTTYSRALKKKIGVWVIILNGLSLTSTKTHMNGQPSLWQKEQFTYRYRGIPTNFIFFILIISIFFTNAAFARNNCDDFKLLMDKSHGNRSNQISKLMIDVDNYTYPNLDIDKDGLDDKVEGGCSSSINPADPCVLSVELSTGKQFNFLFDLNDRFFLINLQGSIFAIVNYAGPNKNLGTRKVFDVNKTGIKQICSHL